MDKFIDEFAEIIEKIEKETIPFLKNVWIQVKNLKSGQS